MREPASDDWARYGRAIIESMREVLAESPDDLHGLLLETADYWLSLGLVIGIGRPADAKLLLKLIQEYDPEDSGELDRDGAALLAGVFE